VHPITHILAGTIATDRQREASSARPSRDTRTQQPTLRRRPSGLRAAAVALCALGQR